MFGGFFLLSQVHLDTVNQGGFFDLRFFFKIHCWKAYQDID